MKIISMPIGEIHPYGKNPRKNDGAVNAVAESIRQFGFNQPIVVDKDHVIIVGHTRYKAAKKLGIKDIPVIVAEDLSDQQAKAYRLADNKTNDLADWDFELLGDELDSIFDFDMSDFGFDINDEDKEDAEMDEDSYYGDERERTSASYNLEYFDQIRSDGFYEMPVIEPVDYIPDELIGFNYVLSSNRRDAGVHFFIDDYQFERVWNEPLKYLDILREFPCVLTPDFSLYMDMPRAMKIWNIYRSRLIGQMMQDYGITVIPTLSWAEPETFGFCFDGLKPGGTVAVSTVGVMRDEDAREVWFSGMDEAVKRLQPEQVLCYGADIGYDFKGIPVRHFKARKFSG